MSNKSICCNADIDCRGGGYGGYDGKDICPIEDYCKKCGQTLAINGNDFWVTIHNPKTGEIIKPLK